MSKISTAIFMTPKSSKITQISSVPPGTSSEIPVKSSLSSHTQQSWLTIVMGLIAVAGIMGTVGIAVVSFAVVRSTKSTTTTTTSTTSTSTTTDTMCYTPPSPRQSNIWLLVGSMTIARAYHASTLISQDNSVLITGGSYGATISSSVDKYIPSTGCFQPMRNMSRTRYVHSADQLPSLSGYVVLAGGMDANGVVLSGADLYHPVTGDIVTIPLSSARYEHSSAIMTSSQLVLIGGYMSGAVAVNSSDMLNTASNSAFVSGTNTMAEEHVYHTATLLGNNSDLVLIVGGLSSGAYLSSAYLYHGTANAFIPLGSGVTLSPGRYCHAAVYLPSPINKVLITGGTSTVIYGSMFLFDAVSLTFTNLATTLIYPRYFHSALLLPNGKVLIIAGYNGVPLRTCELIDPLNNYTVTLVANLTTPRYLHTATLIPDSNNGTVLVCGGYSLPGAAAVNTCELYYV